MSLDIGFDAQVPSLPQGGGAMAGLGQTFTPELSMGTGSFNIPLDLPNGPNDIGPRLTLRYNTAGENGPFGMGFDIPLPRLLRSIARGFPRYDVGDPLLLEGAGELVAQGGGAFRLQVDGGAWRVETHGDGFRLTDREGLYYFLGTTPAGRLVDVASGRVFAWHLERIEDALGNAAVFTWMRDGNQLYLSTLSYGAYQVRFHYEARPDAIRRGRAGFLVTTALRCDSIELRLPSSAQPLLRRWALSYTQAEANGCSLLTGVTLSGFDEVSARLDTPPLRLGYSSFKPRTLQAFQNADDGIAPGPLSRLDRRVELVDWDSDGLPDLLEIAPGGRCRLWPNEGDCTWGRPATIADLPLFASATAAVGFADMDGDGLADLIRLDRPLDGYVPRLQGACFGRPVRWSRAPAVLALAGNSRLVDLDGDGVVDLLASSPGYLTLYYRSDPGGWAERPQVVPRGQAPDLRLEDPHVFLADMTGDGSVDLVRVDAGGVTYWPYLGSGRWDAPVVMESPPELPFDVQPERLFLTDLDGDGCADLLYLDHGRVLYWINEAGNGFSDVHEIDYVPAGRIIDARLADMRGSGTAGILWSMSGPFERGTRYYYLDFSGDTKPYLLDMIDNGMGWVTTIDYTTSTRQSAADASDGRHWASSLPVPVPVVAGMTSVDQATGRTTTTMYRYHEGRYDGVLREFAGFGRVDEDQIGDETAPTLRTTTWFHTGIDPANPGAPLNPDDRRRLRAIRGRIYRQERYGRDGSSRQETPLDRLDQQWTVVTVSTPGGPVEVPRLVSSTRTTLEQEATAAALITTVNNAWDEHENITDCTQSSSVPGDPHQTLTLHTQISYASDPTGRFLTRVWRVRQWDGAGTPLADTISQFDEAAEGTVGARGLVSRRSTLVLDDALVAEVYGASPPDFGSLGYYRRPHDPGWWIDEAVYQRVDDATGLHGRVTDPRGGLTTFDFDANKTYPARIVDPRGNTITAEHDDRVCRVRRLTDASGATYLASFDALARPVAVIEPGDTLALPTVGYEYVTDSLPAVVASHRRAVSGAPLTIDGREMFDGQGTLIERRVRDDAGEIVVESHTYGARGLLARTYAENRPASAAYARPDETRPHTAFRYDALGRPTHRINPDGSVRTWTYGPLLIEEADEEDTRTGPGATHSGTPTRKRLDPTGRVAAVEENLAGRPIRSTYEYDTKGNLTRHVDASGNVVRFWYDLLGRTLRVDRPEHSTVSIFDAAGNAVEARAQGGTSVLREFDECNRPTAVRYNTAASPPVIRLTYHDAGRPAPPEAGAHTVGGRCVRIDDEGGTTIFDYDERGRVALKRYQPVGSASTYDLTFRYRADGQLASILYPDDGRGRTLIGYEYDRRGSLVRIPSVLSKIEYDLAGQRTRLRYANGVEQARTYDDATRRLTAIHISGPGGVLRSTRYTTDLVGNLVRIDSLDPKLAMTFVYDDLYRLSEASSGTAEVWSYRYDDVGNLTQKSDVGDYRYGENGAPATCLTSAGSRAFTYTPLGEMRETPWGTQTFDPMGRLARIVGTGGQGQIDFRYDFAGMRVAARSSGTVSPPIDVLTPDPLYAIESGELILNFTDGEQVVARQASGGSPVFLHPDHLGGLAVVTDTAGQVLETRRYDPYGALLERTGSGPELPVGFTGGIPELWTGLLYLNARYYHPHIGRFISTDTAVLDVLDPIAWSPYAYCRNNPASYADPSGHGFWRIALALFATWALACAMMLLNAFSLGTLTPLAVAGVGLAMSVGGVIGGLATSAHGGSTEDIITGVLVGAAVGGWGAYLGFLAGPWVVSAMHLTSGGFWGSVVAGAVSGTINGTAIGFAAGFAGGRGSLDDVLSKTWQGAAIGLVSGALLGAVTYYLKPPTTSLSSDVVKSVTPVQPTPQPSAPPGLEPQMPLVRPTLPPSYQTTASGAASKVLTGMAGKAAGPVLSHTLPYVFSSYAGRVAIVDSLAGVWDLGYVRKILEWLDGISGGGRW